MTGTRTKIAVGPKRVSKIPAKPMKSDIDNLIGEDFLNIEDCKKTSTSFKRDNLAVLFQRDIVDAPVGKCKPYDLQQFTELCGGLPIAQKNARIINSNWIVRGWTSPSGDKKVLLHIQAS